MNLLCQRRAPSSSSLSFLFTYTPLAPARVSLTFLSRVLASHHYHHEIFPSRSVSSTATMSGVEPQTSKWSANRVRDTFIKFFEAKEHVFWKSSPVVLVNDPTLLFANAGSILSCFKLNAFEYLNLPFDSSPEEVKRQYRKLSLLVHPDKCKHPQAKEAFGALAKAQQLLLDPQERVYLISQVQAAKEELRAKRKKILKKDNASKLKSQVDEGKYEQQYEQSDEFQQQLKLKVRELLTEHEWRRRKMQMRISEEEGRLKKDEEETREMWKRKREHEEQWEGTREQRVSSWRDFMKTGKKTKGKKGEIRPPKLKTEDPNKSYVQRPVKRG